MLRLLPFHLCVCGVILKQQNVSDQVNRSISSIFISTSWKWSTSPTCYGLVMNLLCITWTMKLVSPSLIGRLIRSEISLQRFPRSRIRRRIGHSYLRLGLESSVSLLKRSGHFEEAHQLENTLPKIYKNNSISLQSGSLPNALLDEDQSPTPIAKCLNHYLSDTEESGSLSEIIGRAEPTGGFSSSERLQDLFASALFLLMFRRSLVSQPDSSTVALFPSYTAKWFNVSVEVSNMPTTNGEVGYAVRWHGDRPALLWEGKVNSQITLLLRGLIQPGK